MRTLKQLIFDAIFQSNTPPAYDYDTERVARRAVNFILQDLEQQIDQLSTENPQYNDALDDVRAILRKYEC
jgi:hypothetical protein